MPENSYKIEHKKRGRSIFAWFEDLLNMDVLREHGIPVKYLPYFLYVAAFTILYIGNSHHGEETIRKIDKLEVQVEDLRADYITLKSDYMYERLQSEVAKKVAGSGLKESQQPPSKIEVEKGEY